ncbi:MAG TPA: PQQ-binding-like beta-propeller repeat protein [Verrucomicrobiae bacterium]|nr:PQQ-binding-like beta-propeller repeat protein [Verrucomicrobiae bacterium]
MIKAALSAIVIAACSFPVQAAGRNLLLGDDSTHRLAILREDGSIAWETRVGPIHDASVLPNGNILYQQGWTKIIEVTSENKTVWEYDAATSNGNTGKRVEVHAFQRVRMEDGGLTMIAESGTGRIIEVDRAGRLHREIKLKRDHPDAHMDTRLVRKIANGNYLVAEQNDGFVREYDPSGKIVWEYEQPLFGKERKPGHGPEAFGNFVFSAIRLPNGNTLIGGGNGHCVLEVTPQKEIVWRVDQNDLPGITLAWVTRVQRLPNGNTIIGNCHAGPDNPQLIEITSDKKVVWTFKDFKNFGNSTTVQTVLGYE